MPTKPNQFHPSGKDRSERRREYDRERRAPWHAWYSTEAWKRASDAFKASNPLCAECERNGRMTLTQVTDHIKAHKGDLDLFWDQANWQPLCVACHNRKTALEEKFGR